MAGYTPLIGKHPYLEALEAAIISLPVREAAIISLPVREAETG